ncbi:MAG: hypothetical protein ACO20H_01580 [Bacteriovoracaceae bacterium]
MKNLIILFILLFTSSVMSQNLDNILRSYDTSTYDMRNQGFKVLDGEWTWVGKNLDADKLRMVVTKSAELVKMEDVVEIEFQKEQGQSIDEIKNLILSRKLIPRKDFKALIIK